MYKYKVSGTLLKDGGTPTSWVHFSNTKLTQSQCEKMLSKTRIIGVSSEQIVKISNFKCTLLNPAHNNHLPNMTIIPSSADNHIRTLQF